MFFDFQCICDFFKDTFGKDLKLFWEDFSSSKGSSQIFIKILLVPKTQNFNFDINTKYELPYFQYATLTSEVLWRKGQCIVNMVKYGNKYLLSLMTICNY